MWLKRIVSLLLVITAAYFPFFPAAAAADDGLSILIVIDNSSSMVYSDPNKDVLEKLKIMITDMDKNASAGIAVFDNAFSALSPVVPLGTPGNVEELCEKLDSIRYTGDYTDAGAALAEADAMLKTAAKPVLIFVSDGAINVPGNEEFTAKGASNASRNAFRELAKDFHYPFYPILVNYGLASDDMFEDNLSAVGRSYFYIKNKEETGDVFAALTGNLQHAYYTLETFCVNSGNEIVSSAQEGDHFGFFVQFRDNNSEILTSPYAAQCTAILEINENRFPMTLTDEGTAFFSEISFDEAGQYDAAVTVLHESGKTYEASSTVTIEALPEEAADESVEEETKPEPEQETEPSANEMIGVFVFCITLGAIIAAVSVARNRRNQKPPAVNIAVQYKLVDEFNHMGPELGEQVSVHQKILLADILTTKDNAGYVFHDINNISFKISRNGSLMVENESRYKIRMEDGDAPATFELAANEWIQICPVGDIHAATILLKWQAAPLD